MASLSPPSATVRWAVAPDPSASRRSAGTAAAISSGCTAWASFTTPNPSSTRPAASRRANPSFCSEATSR